MRPGMASPSAEVQTREAQHARPKAAAGSPRSCVSPDGPRLSTPGRPRRRGHVPEPAAPAGCRAGEARFTKAFGGRPPSERPARAEAHTAARPGHRALGSGSPAAPAARAGRPFPAEGGADAPAGARGAEVGAHVRGQSRLSRSRGGPRDVAELCSGDGDAAQAATAGGRSLSFSSCLSSFVFRSPVLHNPRASACCSDKCRPAGPGPSRIRTSPSGEGLLHSPRPLPYAP